MIKYISINRIIEYMEDLSPEDKVHFYDALSNNLAPNSPYVREGNVIKDKRSGERFGIMDDYASHYEGRLSEEVFDGSSPEMYKQLVITIQ